MTSLPDLKQLAQVIDLCRKKGVSSITLGDIRLEIREEAPKSTYKRKADIEQEADPVDPYKNFPTGELTEEQLMFYSTGGLPENDPALKDS
jgi:hypothetical protein